MISKAPSDSGHFMGQKTERGQGGGLQPVPQFPHRAFPSTAFEDLKISPPPFSRRTRRLPARDSSDWPAGPALLQPRQRYILHSRGPAPHAARPGDEAPRPARQRPLVALHRKCLLTLS